MRPDTVAMRGMDLALAWLAIAATSPLWIAAAAAVRLTSAGPALYRGRRVGRDGRVFTMYKFRTMRPGADRSGPGITGARDPRVTAIGRVLRASKLDELPQLLNVLRGDMSLVGPRPEAERYVDLYDERQRQVLSVRPGITGPAQLEYRHEEKLLGDDDIERQYCTEVLPHKLEIDLEYVRTRSLASDLCYLVLTVQQLFSSEPAAASTPIPSPSKGDASESRVPAQSYR